MRQLLGEVSDEFECTMGVRQGESLSPFLFSLFLNDLEETLVEGNHAGLISVCSCYYTQTLLPCFPKVEVGYKRALTCCMIIVPGGSSR